MGITLEFKQVSPYLLNKLKEYPDFTGIKVVVYVNSFGRFAS